MTLEADQARSLLEQQRAQAESTARDLERSFANIVDAAQGSNGDDEHDVEGDTVAVARAHVDSLVRANRRQVAAIDAALARIASGDYGLCQGCGQPISGARLEARPSTPWCLECARVHGP